MVRFIDDQREAHGVEPICKVLPIAPSTYYDHLAKRADPARLSDRARRDAFLRPEIERVFDDERSLQSGLLRLGYSTDQFAMPMISRFMA